MKKILKWVGIVLGGLIGLLVIAVIVMIVSTNNRLTKQYSVTVEISRWCSVNDAAPLPTK